MTNLLAVFAPIERKWIEMAVEYFEQGNNFLYFYTNSKNIGNAEKVGVKKIYFKIKGENFISAAADFVELLTENPKVNIFEVNAEIKAKYFYSFKNLKVLKQKIPLSEVTRFPSKKILRNDTPGVCVINDPLI